METRANYIAVGLFALVALVATFVLVFWFGRYGEDENLVPVNVRIQGSVSGLGPGSLVQFNGINVGRVQGLSLDPTDPRVVIVHTAVNSRTPLRENTRATIGIRGLSGGAFVQLEGGTPDAQEIMKIARLDDAPPTLQGDPAALSDLLDRVNGIAVRAEQVMDVLERFVTKNDKTVSNTLDNVEKFSDALAENSDGVRNFMNSAGDVAVALGNLSGKLDGSVSQFEAILAAVDPESVKTTVSNIESFSTGLTEQRKQIETLIASVNQTAEQLNTFSNQLNTTLAKVDSVVDVVEPKRIASAIENIDKSAAKASEVLAALDGAKLNEAVDNISSSASSINKVVSEVDEAAVKAIVSDLSTASKNANTLIAELDAAGINKAIEGISAAAEGVEKTVVGAQEIVADVRKVTEPLAARGDEIQTIVSDLSSAASGAKDLMTGFDQAAIKTLIADLSDTSKSVSSLVSAVDAAKVNKAVESFSKAADSAETVIGSAEGVISDIRKVTGPFGERSDDIQTIVNDIAELSSRLNASSKKVDDVIEQASNMFGSGAGEGLVADTRRTLAEFRRTARNLDLRIAEVTKGVNNFTGRGLAGTQELIRDARRSINRIDRVIRNLESNPSSLITGSGGSRVRETSAGRPRR